MKTGNIKGVSRIDQDSNNTHGFYARVCFDKKTHCKFFADHLFGGRDKAKEEAIAWRIRKRAELGLPETTRVVARCNRISNTGIIGVRWTGRSYQVHINPEAGRLRRRTIPVGPEGKLVALKKAIQLRRAWEREVYGDVIRANWVKAFGLIVEGGANA